MIARGPKMAAYLRKYQNRDPQIPLRNYPRSMRKNTSIKAGDFAGTLNAIRHGRHSVWDNPKG